MVLSKPYMNIQSNSIEDYLKYIFLLQSADKKVTTSALAASLNISPASVSEMISKLSREGLIENTPYHGFHLTDAGNKIAVNLVRKHRLIEVFLHDHLEYNWDEVHNEAEKFEHACSDMYINKLEKYLGYPKFDPHGDPIPDKNGKMSSIKSYSLNEGIEGKSYLVSKVKDTSDELLKYMTKIGIKLKTKIIVINKLDFDKSILVRVDKKEHLLSNKIAENISVTEE